MYHDTQTFSTALTIAGTLPPDAAGCVPHLASLCRALMELDLELGVDSVCAILVVMASYVVNFVIILMMLFVA